MANPDIGQCPCPLCGESADVRKQGKGAQLLYLNCDRCGHITPRLQFGQDWILERATMYGPEGKPQPVQPALAEAFDVQPAPAPAPSPAAAPNPTPPPAPPARKRPFLATILDT